MEDDIIEIDKDNRIDARYRGWEHLDSNLFKFTQVESLDVSFNQLKNLPEEIGTCLRRLVRLNCSCNRISQLPMTFCRLSKLKELKANGNAMKNLPENIGNMPKLSTLILSENALEFLPNSLGNCSSLRKLQLQNNKLTSLPLSLASLYDFSKEVNIDLTNNPELSIIPREVEKKTDAILWVLNFLNEKSTLLEILVRSIKELSEQAKENDDSILHCKERIRDFHSEKQSLMKERDSIRSFIVVRHWYRTMREKIKGFVAYVAKPS